MFTLPVNLPLGFRRRGARHDCHLRSAAESVISGVCRAMDPNSARSSPPPQPARTNRIARVKIVDAGANRVVAGTVHDERRHAQLVNQRRGEFRAVRVTKRAAQAKRRGKVNAALYAQE